MNDSVICSFSGIASGIYLEGLAVDYDRNIVWFSDVIAGGVHGIYPDGKIQTLNPDRMWTGGILLNDDGSVLSSGAGGIKWNNPETGQSGWLLNSINAEPISGVNEMVGDGQGGLYFGTCDIENIARGATPKASDIYRLTCDGDVIKVASDIGFANGLMLDTQRQKLYCNDTFNCSWSFHVNPDLTLSNRTLLLEKNDADGMVLDVDGNVWITGFRSGHLSRVSPLGHPLESLSTPAEAVTQVRFGGEDMRDVYLTAVPVDGGDNLKDGEIPTEKHSVLYRGRSSIPGLKLSPTRFSLR